MLSINFIKSLSVKSSSSGVSGQFICTRDASSDTDGSTDSDTSGNTDFSIFLFRTIGSGVLIAFGD